MSAWARQAEVCGEYLKKGRGVRVVGRLKQDRWTEAEGKMRSRIIIVAEHVEFKPQFNKDKQPGADAAQEKDEAAAEEQEEDKEAVSF